MATCSHSDSADVVVSWLQGEALQFCWMLRCSCAAVRLCSGGAAGQMCSSGDV